MIVVLFHSPEKKGNEANIGSTGNTGKKGKFIKVFSRGTIGG